MEVPIISGLVEQYEMIKEQFIVMQQALAPLNLTKWQIARLLAAQLYRDTPIFVQLAVIFFIGLSLLLALDSLVFQPYLFSLRRLGIPQLKPSKGKHAFDYKPMLDEAARKYPDRPWFFGYSGFELVVFPSAYVNEIRRLPARTASLVDFLTTVQFGGYRLIGTDDSSNTLHKTASTDLARSIGPLGPARQETARRAWESNLGPCPQWKKVSLFWTALDVVVATGATGLVGEPLSLDKRWLRAVRLLPIGAGVGVYISCLFPRLLRPIAATVSYFPALMVYKYMSYLLRPTIEQAMQEHHSLINEKETPEKKLTLVHMLLGRYRQGEIRYDQLVKDVITATFESTPTTAVSLYWMLTELLQRPDLVEELREEITGVLQDGKLPATQLTELPKLDSFMRESARVNTFHYLTVFERSGNVGGVWVYDARLPLEPPFPHVTPPTAGSQYVSIPGNLTAEQASIYHASPGPCYAGLKNNIGTAVMRSSLLDWPEGTDKVITAEQVKDYIGELARKHRVLDHVQFWTRVENISKSPDAAQWNVRTKKFVRDDDAFHFETQHWSFDAVVVASGHYDVPRVPDIPGLAAWKERYPDRVTHSKTYRSANSFTNSTVLIIGAGVSSYDIANEIDHVGGRTYQVTRDPTRAGTARQEGLAESCERVPNVRELVLDPTSETGQQHVLADTETIPGKVILENGRELTGIHHVVVATGYITTYPFLGELEKSTVAVDAADDKIIVTSDGYTLHNLHKDIFYIPDPTLAFIGVLYNTSTFSLFDFQARILAKIFKGEAKLPSRDEMYQLHQARKAKHKPDAKFHSLSLQDVAYAEEILESVNRDLENAGLPKMIAFDEKWHKGFAELKAFVASVRPDIDQDKPLTHGDSSMKE
ncbi:hypothetical protein jhhlp_001744 [Lomentospora prolificans]|uniref:FAD/NAD(P)-binding domain-containing protein n=1 Tax=Lomentospora prolificans TaxID=41688 RepID=A0A2N3NH44_9PEZI|nr:hypothetical protein jhhlp_001744 [Lomentospora prolificans]